MARTYTNSLSAVAASFPGSVYEPIERLNGAQDYGTIEEPFTVPAVADSLGRYRIELDYAINSNVTPVVTVGGVELARIPYPAVPSAGQVGVAVNDVPILEFHADRAGQAGTISYQPLGSVRTASWENQIQVELEAVQEAVAEGGIGGGGVTSVNGETGIVTLSAADVGAAAALHTHNASDINAGTLDSSRLPTISVNKGGTGLTTIGTAGQVLKVNAGGTALEYGSAGGGSGDVTAAGDNAFTGTNSFKNINLDMDGSSSGSPRTIGFTNFGADEYWRAFDTVQGGWAARTQFWNYYGIKIKGNNQSAGIPAFEAGNGADPSLEVVGTQPGSPVLAVTGAASQSQPLQEWRNSSGTVLASVSASGAFSGVPTLTGNNTMSGANTFSGANSFTGTTTLKNINIDMDGSDTSSPRTISPANISVGEAWRMMDFAQGGWAVKTQLYSYYGFTIKGGNQTAVPSFVSGNNGDASLEVLGSDQTGSTTLAVTAAASQTGDLQEWRNSSGTMLAQVTVGGKFETTDEVELTTASKGIILKSPDGTRYRVTVANGGTLSVAAV